MNWNQETIYEARKARGLSQEALAAALDCRQQTISEWELDLYRPGKKFQEKLTAYFNPEPKDKSEAAIEVH